MTPAADSPQARLAASRKTLVRLMARAVGRPDNDLTIDSHESKNESADPNLDIEISGNWQILTQALRSWWRHHPAQLAIDIGRPFLSKFARDNPIQLLGIAAGVGAAVVFIKPWRLISLTGLAVAAFKSANLSSTLLSMLTRSVPGRNVRPVKQPPKDQS